MYKEIKFIEIGNKYGIIFSDSDDVEWFETEQLRNERALELEELYNYEIN